MFHVMYDHAETTAATNIIDIYSTFMQRHSTLIFTLTWHLSTSIWMTHFFSSLLCSAVQGVTKATTAWVEDFVLKYKLCPFAEHVFVTGGIRYR